MLNAEELRPRTIGELLDRAITTYVRGFVPLFAIVALVSIPFAIVFSFFNTDQTRLVHDYQQILTATTPAARTAALDVLRADSAQSSLGAVVGLGFIGSLLGLVSTSALVAYVNATIEGRATSIARAYRAALRCIVPQIVVAIAFTAIVFVSVIVFAFGAVLLALPVAALSLASKLTALVLGVILALAGGLAVIAFLSALFFAYELALVSVVVEDANPIRAIGLAVRRSFARSIVRRAILTGLAATLLSFVGGIVITALTIVLANISHIPPKFPTAIINGVAGVILSGVITVFFVYCARDVRVRREGLDLLVAAGGGAEPIA